MKANIISTFLIFSIIVLQTINTADIANEIKCNKKSERLMDNALSKLLVVGQKNLRFPENAPQLRVYCNDMKRFLGYISAYGDKCMPNFAREATKILMLSANKQMKLICKSGKLSPKANELLKAASCANAGLDNFKKCNLDIIDAFMGIINADLKLRIPMACCHYHKMRECLITEAEEVKVCTRSTVDFVNRFIGSIFDPMLQFLCIQYDESNEKCEQLIRETPKRNETIPRTKSVLPPLTAIAASIGDIPEADIGSF